MRASIVDFVVVTNCRCQHRRNTGIKQKHAASAFLPVTLFTPKVIETRGKRDSYLPRPVVTPTNYFAWQPGK